MEFEAKWDGWRALVYVDGALRVRTRTGRQVSDSLPELAGLVEALYGHGVILDGELVACPNGRMDSYSGMTLRWANSPNASLAAALTPLYLDE
jgi:bifunctional non-homologous end joining protein LigD